VGVCVGVDEPSLERERGVDEADIMEDGEPGLEEVKVDLRRSLFSEAGDVIVFNFQKAEDEFCHAQSNSVSTGLVFRIC
jgi:hypothetical protein